MIYFCHKIGFNFNQLFMSQDYVKKKLKFEVLSINFETRIIN